MPTLDDYEEGVLYETVKLNKKWWEFWKPTYEPTNIGYYTRVGAW